MFASTASDGHVTEGTQPRQVAWADRRAFEWDLSSWIDFSAWSPARVWSSASLMLASALGTVTLVFVFYMIGAAITRASFFTGMVGAVFGLYLIAGLVLCAGA